MNAGKLKNILLESFSFFAISICDSFCLIKEVINDMVALYSVKLSSAVAAFNSLFKKLKSFFKRDMYLSIVCGTPSFHLAE